MEVAQKHQDQLERIKKNVRNSHDYFQANYDRYNEFRSFIFNTSLNADEINLLATMMKPQLEFNICEAYISRLLGEFSKQEPDIMVSADDQNSADPTTIKIIEQHLRHTFSDQDAKNTRYEVYKELLSGGFSVIKIKTDYSNPMSMHQCIYIDKAYDPTLCGFDPLSQLPHKGDGRYQYENFPLSKEAFEEKYPNISLKELSFKRNFQGFNWSYTNNNEEILIVCDYYEKKKKDVKIALLVNGQVMPMKDYEKKKAEWQGFEAFPAIVDKPRWTTIETICRYRVIENKVIEYEETDFSHFPLIFVDGNSAILRTPKNTNVHQMTRPYIYHMKSTQRLKNYTGIAYANRVENLVEHKFIIKKEALPKEEEWLDAIKNPQKPSTIVVNAFYEENPDQSIPDPIIPVMQQPCPPEILQGFAETDRLSQMILGSYDASLGINNNQLSGVAVVESATQSNSAAMPYIVGLMEGLTRAAEIYVDLLPKYYKTPRTMPIMDEEGKRSFIKVNQQGGMNMFYDANALNVSVKAGASFTVQKSRTLMMVKEIMGMSPLFAQFIAEKGLNFILDNIEGRGVEQLKSMVDQWLQEVQKQKQMAMQMQQQEAQKNPALIKAQVDMQKMKQEGVRDQAQLQLDMAKLRQDEAKIIADLHMEKEKSAVQMVKAETERFSKEVDLALQTHDQHHRHKMDVHDRKHESKGDNQS